ncbi:hypothetical protein F511_11367 [Dorcoceras hygrometricum]|uniref:O-fucosyltransferase family protein n=1 Tax=Dorcoceras hygrometricum TaxID=472368 RepID=A0A2Z7AC72_9LAMI|nr:hypothetical protein F511_11367 [Dorcoceras hygrometricum]
MAVPRRRHQYTRRSRYLLPTISAVSAALLILYLFLSFLAPSHIDQDHLRHPLRSIMMDNGVGKGNPEPLFRVPSSGGVHHRDLWKSKNAQFYHGCSNASSKFLKATTITHPNRFLAIATSGGLNQQRTGITDAVVAARILNATLIVPKLDSKSFWNDNSNFSEIFNVDWFISYLAKDVKIIKELPRRRGQIWTPYTMRVPRKCNERCYISRLVPVLLKKDNNDVDVVYTLSLEIGSMVPLVSQIDEVAVQLTKFDYRLSNKLDIDLQKLRCRVNYHALTFTNPILEMGAKLVKRMRSMGKHYIALHLRFEPDMLAFSGCYYGGGDKERKELGKIRRRWKTLHNNNPDRERRQGRCPLTPEEVGLMLRALGYDRETHLYVASGEVYGGQNTLASLKALFPNFYSKDTIATKEELKSFSAFSSRMAALDFIVCDESDVFVTNNNGNMAKIIAGRRRYFGHKLTIRPNAKKLYKLFLNRDNMTWEEFSSRTRKFQRSFMGHPKEVRPGRGVFHENPSSCICEDSDAKTKTKTISVPHKPGDGSVDIVADAAADDQNSNDEEWSDPEDDDDLNNQTGDIMYNETGFDYDAPLSEEEPELEEMLSD